MANDTIRDRIKKFVRLPAKSILPNPRNWRTHPKQQREALSAVLAEIGFADCVLVREVDSGYELIDGHLRLDLMQDQKVPALILDVTKEEADKILLTLDPLAGMAGVDKDALSSLVEAFGTESDALRGLIDSLKQDAGIKDNGEKFGDEDAEPQIDKAEELRANWGVERGQLWQMGEHLLLCGDSTSADDVATVIGDGADVCFTSPPYGAGNVAKLRDHYVRGADKRESFYVEHDDDPVGWLALMRGWMSLASVNCRAVVCNVQMLADNKRDLVAWVYENSDILCDVIVWDKNHGAPQMQRNVLTNAFEFVFVFGGNGSRSIPFSSFHGTISNVFRLDPRQEKNESADMHRAVMPLGLPAWVLGRLCVDALIVYEPFSGSGTTIIACENLGRKCRAIEISPAYVAVAIQRWVDATGGKPKLLKK